MKISEQVLITYVGGPLHGTQEVKAREELKERISVPSKDQHVIYERRTWSGEGVGFGEVTYARATYALLGMSDVDFFALEAAIISGAADQ